MSINDKSQKKSLFPWLWEQQDKIGMCVVCEYLVRRVRGVIREVRSQSIAMHGGEFLER